MRQSLLAALLVSAPASAAEVIVFGDSWAEGAADELEAALRAAGHRYDVDPRGVGGTTATYWNDTAPTALTDAIAANPDARWVWLSILGNDTFGYHAAGQHGASAANNTRELRELLDRLHASAPDVQVVGFPYDYVNFEQTVDCILVGAAYFPDLVGSGIYTSYHVNQVFHTEVGDVLAAVDAADVRYTTYPLWGTLQRDAGTVGAPNVLLPSPASRMSDCIHPTSDGYRVILDALVDRYWGHAAPDARVTGAPTGPVCEGTDVVLTSVSTDTDAVAWTIDGDDETTDLTRTWTTDGIGEHVVSLRAYGGAWHDDLDVPVVVVGPPDSATSPDVSVCAGDTTTLTAYGGDDVTWSSADATLGTGPSWLATPETTTTYTATVASAPGCEATADVTVTVLPRPALSLEGQTATVPGQAVTLTVSTSADATLTWSAPGGWLQADGTSASVRFDATGSYTVTVTATSPDGCTTVATAQVAVIGDYVDSGDGGTDGGGADACGCRTAHGTAGLVALPLGAAALRRRRRR